LKLLGFYLKQLLVGLLLFHTFLFSATTALNFSDEEHAYLQSKPTIKVCVNPTFAPFEFLTIDGNYEGIGAELLQLVAQKTHLTLEIIQTYSWKESLEKARKNECDILNFIPQTLELNKWLLFSEPLFSDYNVLLTRSEHPYIPNLKKLSNATLALSENTALFERLSYTFPNLTIFSVETEEDALFLVLNQKIDMTVRSATIMSYTLRKQGLLNLKISGILDEFQNVYKIGIVNNNERLRDILNKGIQSLTLQEKETIVNKYTPIVIDKTIDEEVWYVLFAIALGIITILLWNYILREQVKKAVATNLLNQKIMTQQAKQAELGQLIGNISHQWREPLSNLSGVNLIMIGLLEHNKKVDKAFLLQKFKEVENTLEFMSQTMQNFLEFYKPSTVQQHFNIYDALQQTLSLVETNILAYKIVIDIQGDKEAQLFGIKNEFMQVWLNLMNNAIRALQNSNVTPKILSIDIHSEYMRFCDNAGGAISHTDLTKGVGLSMCSSILKKYHKKLSFDNTSKGVCVLIEPHEETFHLF
jgi:ABC-type amino acid transport substrate-binding protein